MKKSVLLTTAVALALAVLSAVPIEAQNAADEVLLREAKDARVDAAGAGPPPSARALAPPRTGGEYFGYRVILGGVYEPSVFPNETWIFIACVSTDPRVEWDDSRFGFDSVRVHAVVSDIDSAGNLRTRVNTDETSAFDEAVCSLSYGADSSFIEVPRNIDVAAVSLFSSGHRGQRVEAVEVTDRAVPRP